MEKGYGIESCVCSWGRIFNGRICRKYGGKKKGFLEEGAGLQSGGDLEFLLT